jgi:hypothetical protein
MTTVIQQLGRLIAQAKHTDKKTGWFDPSAKQVRSFVHEYLPSGSGLDGDIVVDFSRCNSNQVVIDVEYHHMNEVGMYTGWTNHSIVVTPSFDGIDVCVTGKNKNDIKEYLLDLFYDALSEEFQ